MAKARLWNISFFLVFMAEYMLQIGLYGIRPIVSAYAVSLGASLAYAGFLSGIMSGVSLLFRPVCGAISDRFNMAKILLIASIAITLGQFGCAFFPTLSAVLVCESVKGIAFTFKSTLVISATALLVPKERLGTGVGIISITFTTAGAIGPIVSTALINVFSYTECYVFSGCISLLGVAALALLVMRNPTQLQVKEQTRKNVESGSKTPFWKKIIYAPAVPFSCIAGVNGCAYGTLLALLFVVEEQGYIENAFLYFAVYTCVVVFTRIFGGALADKLGVKIVVPMVLISLVGSIPLIFSGSTVCLLVGAVAMALGQGPAYAVLQAESVRNAPEEETGKASNTFFILMDLGMFLSPVIGGIVLDWFSFAGLFTCNCVFLLIGLILSVIFIALPMSRERR